MSNVSMTYAEELYDLCRIKWNFSMTYAEEFYDLLGRTL